MKKILFLVVALATIASADGFVIGGNIGYAKSDTTASSTVNSVSVEGKAYTYATNIGYEYGPVRGGFYMNNSAIESDLDSKSKGIYMDYIFKGERISPFVGGMYGKGDQDSSLGAFDFTDKGIRGGILFDVDNLELELGVKRIWRDYDTIVVSGTGVNIDSDVLNFYIGLNFKL